MSQSATPPEQQNKSANHAGHTANRSALGNALPGESCNPSAPGEDNEPYNRSSQSPWWKPHEPGMFVTQILLLIIGGYVAKIYSCQLNQMIESNRINRESLESVQRAYVSFDSINLDAAPATLGSEELLWVFSAAVENAGTTPALDKTGYFDGSNQLSSEPTEAQFIGSITPTIGGQIGPRAHGKFGRKVTGNNFILGNFPLLSVGKPDFVKFMLSRKVFFWGWIVYGDIFPKTDPHVTEFCVEVNGIAIRKTETGLIPVLTVDECRTHNCTDRHCDDYKSLAGFARRR